MSKTRKVKYFIIGAGTAGLGARRMIAAETDDYLVADPGPLGTTCARVGCMPSKLLIAAAERAHEVGEEHRFGVESHGRTVDGPKVLERVRRERDRFVGFVTRAMEPWMPDHLLPHRATFIAPNTLQVGDEIIEAERIVIAVGSTPFIPPALRPFKDYVLTSDTLFEEPDLPKSVAVIGMGVIGLELGQALHRLGVPTWMFGRGGLIGGAEDPIIRADVLKIFQEELNLHPHIDLPVEMEVVEGGVRKTWTETLGPGGSVVFEKLLVAAGRVPNVAGLGLESSGLPLSAYGIPLYDPETLQVGESAVYMAGDVLNERPILHEAADEGRIAGAGAVNHPDPPGGARRVALNIVFSDPNIVQVGMHPRDFDGTRHCAGEADFWDQGRSRVMGINKGTLRVYGDRMSRRILGAEGVGPRQEHLAHLIAWAIGAGLTVDQALEMPFYHPVIEEGLRTALRSLKAVMDA